MIRTIVKYQIKDKDSFTKKVIPYIYGSGQYYPEIVTNVKWINNKRAKVIMVAESISQLIDATVGMLRFSPGSYLENIDIKENDRINRFFKLFPKNKIIIGTILKPALADLKTHYQLIDLSIKLGFDFVKDDDVVEFSPNRVKNIYKFCSKKIVYFHKVSQQKQFTNHPTIIIPWVDGWSLAETFSKTQKAPLMIHCANMPLQISWRSHVILSRLAGAEFIIVPDPKFDKSTNLKEILEGSSRKIENLPSPRILIAGAVTPERVDAIKKSLDKKLYSYLGFIIGSWFTKIHKIK